MPPTLTTDTSTRPERPPLTFPAPATPEPLAARVWGIFDDSPRRMFAIATAAIAVHILVDSFVAIEPGASRADHLFGALASLALAAAVVGLYPRLRAGLAAVAALLFGSLALVSAVLVIQDAAAGGVSGASWTGFLQVPAGLLLIVLGARGLWLSRKRHGRRYLRRVLIAIAAIIIVYEFVVPVAIGLVATQKPRTWVEAVDLGRPYETVKLLASDGLELSAWYVPSQNGAAVIAFPGRSGPVAQARLLVEHGYGVLMLDMRGQGESEGDPNAFGWESYRDLDSAIAYLEGRADVSEDRIGGLGLSVGGELLLEAAARNPALMAVVSEGAGARSVRESFTRQGVSPVQIWLQLPFDAMPGVPRRGARRLPSGNEPRCQSGRAGACPRRPGDVRSAPRRQGATATWRVVSSSGAGGYPSWSWMLNGPNLAALGGGIQDRKRRDWACFCPPEPPALEPWLSRVLELGGDITGLDGLLVPRIREPTLDLDVIRADTEKAVGAPPAIPAVTLVCASRPAI